LDAYFCTHSAGGEAISLPALFSYVISIAGAKNLGAGYFI